MHDQPPKAADRASLTPVTFVRPSLMEALVVGQRSGPPVEHPGWTEARTSLLTEIADGPALLGLLGPPGTGKTWLLRTILADVQQCGRTAAIMSGGVLPFEFAPGKVALLDDATKMDAESLAPLAMLCGVTVVLAGRTHLTDCLERLPGPPIVVPLAPLSIEDVPRFVAMWLKTHGLPEDVADEATVARWSAHSEGVPRALVRLLRASLVMAAHRGWAQVSASCVDEVAALRNRAPDAPLTAWPVLDPRSLTDAAAVPVAQVSLPVAVARLPVVPPIRGPRVAANAFTDLDFASIRRTCRRASGVAVAALGAAMLLWGLLSDFPALKPDPMTAEVLAPEAGPAATDRNLGRSAAATAPDNGSTAIDRRDALAETDLSSLAPGEASPPSQMAPPALAEPRITTSDVSAMSLGEITGPASFALRQGAPVLEDQTEAPPPGLPALLAGEVEGPASSRGSPSVAMAAPPDRAVPSVPDTKASPEADAVAAGEIAGPMGGDRSKEIVQPPADFAGELFFLSPPKASSARYEIRPSPGMIAREHDDFAAPIYGAVLSYPGEAVPEPSGPIAQTSPDHPGALVQSPTVAMTSPPMTPPTQGTNPSHGTAHAVPAATMHADALRRGAPGLALMAQAGDTMPVLYAKVYRGVRPPPYAEFVAANRAWSGRGGIVVFPAPADGWTRN